MKTPLEQQCLALVGACGDSLLGSEPLETFPWQGAPRGPWKFVSCSQETGQPVLLLEVPLPRP